MKEAFIFFAGLLMVSGFACKSSRAVSNISSLPVMRIDPGPDNPRNSEGDFITLKDGRIVLIYSRYFGESGDDHATAKLTRRESKDGGKTWSTDDKVVVEKEGTMNVMSVSLLRLQNGKIALFYLRKNSQSDCIPMMRLSGDEAATWTDPIPCITDKKGYFVLNNDRVIQLQNGRLVMAVALHQTPEENKWHNNATLFSYYSDDNGATWHSGTAVANPGNVVFQEPGVIELKNGDLMMIIRAGAGVQYKTYSKDKGESWSDGVPTTIQSPLSPATIQRIPSTGDLVMAWNNNGANNPPMKGKRTPFSLAISKDDGNTWQHIRDIETDPDGWYCYTAMHFNKKNILLGYCAGSQAKKTHLSVLAIRQFPIKQLYK